MTDERGLLGSLPKTRPGVESPRRAAARQEAAEAAGDRIDPTPKAGADAPQGPAPQRDSGFEELAKAGLGLAGGVAAVGIRLAGRAAGEIGRAVGRR